MRRLTYLTVFFLPATFIAVWTLEPPQTQFRLLTPESTDNLRNEQPSHSIASSMAILRDLSPRICSVLLSVVWHALYTRLARHSPHFTLQTTFSTHGSNEIQEGLISPPCLPGVTAGPVLKASIRWVLPRCAAPRSGLPGTNMGTETRVQRSRRRILRVRRQQQPSTTTLDDSSSTTTVSRAPHPRLQDHTGSPVETPEVEHVAIPEAVEICEIPEAVELSEISETNEPGGGRHGDFHSHRAAYPRARLFERSALHRPSRIRYRLSDAETSTQDGSTANVTAKAELPPRPKKKGANLSFNDRYGGGSEPDPSHAAAWSSSRSPWSRLTSRNRARVDEAEAEDSEL